MKSKYLILYAILIISIIALVLAMLRLGKKAKSASSPVNNSSISSQSSREDKSPPPSSSETSEEEISSKASSEISEENLEESQEIKAEPQAVNISQGGDYSGKEECLDLTISTGGVNLSNKTVNGDLTIDCGKIEENITITDVKVTGNINVISAGGNIILDGVTANELSIKPQQYTPNVEVSGDTSFSKTYVLCNANLSENNLSSDAKGYAHIGIGGYLAQLWQDITLTNIDKSLLTVNFPANINLIGNTNISEVYAAAKCHFYGDGGIKVLYVNSGGISYENKIEKISYFGEFEAVAGGNLLSEENIYESENATAVKLPVPEIENIVAMPENSCKLIFTRVEEAQSYLVAVFVNDKLMKEINLKNSEHEKLSYTFKENFKKGDKITFSIIAVGNGSSTADSDASYSEPFVME